MGAGNRIDFKLNILGDNFKGFDDLKRTLSDIDKLDFQGFKRAFSDDSGLRANTKTFNEFRDSAKQLQEIFNRSYRLDLNTVDIVKFSQELKGLDLSSLSKKMDVVGDSGQKAFRAIAEEAVKSNVYVKQSSEFLDSMSRTFVNTFKWGIASSFMNSLSGSLSKAYSYVKVLDDSLNDIRIVSGSSADEMDRFARNASQAAIALGSTTKTYADAALIYYQQGLAQDDVIARTNTTIKMSNVLKESASDVSNYMTAIWSNYDQGSHNLEYFGDVITALGAKTAASSQEIAQGLEKFSAVSRTIGLSYEYATSIIATVVAKTRQSADVVGTSFKTLFARIQGLKLGETLDDGTSLNKYSEALYRVGIDLKDQNGELKNMDDLLDEMGSKWNNLSRDQRVALAQTVAGTRQYNQLVALMDNWSFMQENLATAYSSAGTLEEQQAIYLDSMQAHLNSLKAANERFYKTLLDPDTIKGGIDLMTKLVTGLTDFVSGLGGGEAALLHFGAILTRVFSQQIGNNLGRSFQNFVSQIQTKTANASKEGLMQQLGVQGEGFTDAQTNRLFELRKQLNESGLNTVDKQKEANALVDQQIAIDRQQKAFDNAKKSAVDFYNIVKKSAEDHNRLLEKSSQEIEQMKLAMASYKEDFKEKADIGNVTKNRLIRLSNRKGSAGLSKNSDDVKKLFEAMSTIQKEGGSLVDSSVFKKFEAAKADFESNNKANERKADLKAMTSLYQQAYDSVVEGANKAAETFDKTKLEGTQDQLDNKQKKLNENTAKTLDRNAIDKAIEGYAQIVGSVTQIAAGVNTWSQMQKILSDETLTTSEKWSQLTVNALSSIGSIAMGINGVVEGTQKAKGGLVAMASAISMAKGGAEITSMGAALKMFGTSLVGILPVILLVGGAVALIAMGMKNAAEEANRYSDALKEQQDKVKDLQQAYDDVNAKLKEFQQLISDYQSGIDGLNSLTRGTEEYAAALEKSNEKAKELIEKFQLFDKWKMENGQIIIDPQALSDAENSLERSKNLVGNNLVAAEIQANGADITNEANKIFTSNKFMAGSSQFGVQTAEEVEAVARKLYDLQKASGGVKLSTEQFGEVLEGMGAKVSESKDGFMSVYGEMYKLVDKIAKADPNNIAQIGGVVDSIAEDKFGGKIKQMATGEDGKLDKAKADQMEYELNKIVNRGVSGEKAGLVSTLGNLPKVEITNFGDFQKQMSASGYSMGSITDVESAIKTFLEQRGRISEGENVDISTKGGKVLSATNMAGEELLKDFDLSKVYSELFNTQQIQEQIEKFKSDTDGMTTQMGEAYLALQNGAINATSLFQRNVRESLASGIAASGTTGEVDMAAFSKSISPEQAGQLMGMNTPDLMNFLGLTDEQLAALGFDSAVKFKDSFQQAIAENYNMGSFLESQATAAQGNIQGIDTILGRYEEDKDPTAKQLEGIEAVKEKYAELFEGVQEGSHQYLEVLREIKEYEEQAILDNLEYKQQALQEEADAKLAQLDELQAQAGYMEMNGQDGSDQYQDLMVRIQAQTDDFNNTMDELREANKEIDIQINADIQSDVDSAFGLAEEFDDVSQYITDSMTVTADQAKQIMADGYGAMLQNAEITADGQIQLDDATVDAFVANRQHELEQTKQEKIQQLQMEKGMLITQLNILKAKQTALGQARAATAIGDKKAFLVKAQMLEGEYQAERAKMSAELKTQDEKNKKTSENSVKLYTDLKTQHGVNATNQMKANDAANKSSHSLAVNVVDYYNRMHNAVSQYADAVKAAAKGEKTGFSASGGGLGGGVFSGAWDGGSEVTSTYTVSAGQLEDSLKKINDFKEGDQGKMDDLIDQMLQDTNDQIAAIEAQIGAVDAGIAVLSAASTNLAKKGSSAGRAGSGSGKKGGSGGGGGGGSGKKPSGGGSGSKGSGGTSAKDPDVMESLENKADRYHDVDVQIKQLTNDLDLLSKAEKRLSGEELIDNLMLQLGILQEQAKVQANKLTIAKAEAAEMRASLATQGLLFKSDGAISNYNAIMIAKQNNLNNMIKKYNSMSAEEQKNYKKTYDAAKKDFEKFQEQVKKYDALITDTVPNTAEKINDLLDKEIELKVKTFNMSFEISMDLTKAEKDWNKFKNQIINGFEKDSPLGDVTEAFDNLGSYFAKDLTGGIQQGATHVETILKELEKLDNGDHSGIYSAYDSGSGAWVDNRAKAIDDLKKGYTELANKLEDAQNLADSVEKVFVKGINNVSDAFNKQMKALDFFDKQLSHDLKMTEMLYGDNAYSKLGQYYDQKVLGSQKEIALLQEQVDYWTKLMQAAEAAGDKEALKEYQDNWQKTIESLNSSIEQWSNNLLTRYKNTINDIIDQLNSKLTSGVGLDYVGEELSLLKDKGDDYLDTINAVFAVENLKKNWQDSINGTNDIAAQEELTQLMNEQIKMLEEKGRLSKYNVDRAEKEYQISLKQIALKNAQKSSGTMKLRRDGSGNYSYQFVADEDKIAQAQKDLAAAQNELYNFDKGAYQNNLSQMYSTWKEFQDKIAKAYVDYADDQDALSERLTLLQTEYQDKINFLTGQNIDIRQGLQESAFVNLASMYQADIEQFTNLSEIEKNLVMEELVPTWNSGVQQMITTMIGEGGFKPVVTQAFTDLGAAATEYNAKQQDIKKTVDEIITSVLDAQKVLTTRSNDAVSAAQKELTGIQNVRKEVQSLIKDYEKAKDAAIKATAAGYAKWQQENKKTSASSLSATKKFQDDLANQINGTKPTTPAKTTTTKTNTVPVLKVGGRATLTSGSYYYDSYGENPIGTKYLGVKGGVIIDHIVTSPDSGQNHTYHIKSADGLYGDLGWVKKSQLVAMKTGGYTGEFGNGEKLGILHEKELVLNQRDTSYMLEIVKMVRDMASSFGMSNLASLNGLGKAIKPDFNEAAKDIEQNVHITATFPSVKDRTEIEKALENLVTDAYQYIGKR